MGARRSVGESTVTRYYLHDGVLYNGNGQAIQSMTTAEALVMIRTSDVPIEVLFVRPPQV